MKLKDISRINVNSANNQTSLNLKAKKLKEFGLTPKELLNAKINFSGKERNGMFTLALKPKKWQKPKQHKN